MTVMVSTIAYGLESPNGGAVAFAQRWDAERDRSAFPDYLLPDIRGGVPRDETLELFRAYVASHSSEDALTVWARGLTAL
jgi:hypothetical protein